MTMDRNGMDRFVHFSFKENKFVLKKKQTRFMGNWIELKSRQILSKKISNMLVGSLLIIMIEFRQRF